LPFDPVAPGLYGPVSPRIPVGPVSPLLQDESLEFLGDKQHREFLSLLLRVARLCGSANCDFLGTHAGGARFDMQFFCFRYSFFETLFNAFY
jgi:hypothetical protein